MVTVTDTRAIIAYSWNGSSPSGSIITNQPVFITYSFQSDITGINTSYAASYLATFSAFNAAQQATAREAFRQWDEASGIRFFEVPSGQGDIKLANFDFSAPGSPYTPQQAAAFGGGGIVFVSQTQTAASVQLYTHEIGHNLGLKHSFQGEYILPAELDTYATTVMSYTSGGSSGAVLGSLDRQAAAELYGDGSRDGTQVASWSWDQASYTLTQTGFDSSERIKGVGGNNVIFAAGGNDTVDGSPGNDELHGGAGNDIITGNGGQDRLFGDDGNDIFYVSGSGLRSVDGGAGSDTLTLRGAYYQSNTLSLPQVIADGGSILSIESINIFGGSLADTLVGGESADNIYGDAGNDMLVGNGGDDTLQGGGGVDRLFGGAGNDTLFIGTSSFFADGGGGTDTLSLSGQGGQAVDFSLAAMLASGSVITDVETISLSGNALNDRITGANLDDNIYGYDGADTLDGGGGGDYLSGGAGNDVLSGGTGADRLDGGEGADLFIGSLADFAGDLIYNLSLGDRLHVTDGVVAGVSYSRNLSQITLAPGVAVTAYTNSTEPFRVVASAQGGIDIAFGQIVVPRAAQPFDFDGNGASDLLWRNVSGTFTEWQATLTASGGIAFASNVYVNVGVGTDWQVQGTIDFTGDGSADILWRNVNSGVFTIWSGNGTSFTPNTFSDGTVSTAFRIAGLGDFDGDGKTDLLFRNEATGQFTEWRATGTGFTQNVYAATVDKSWKVQAVADFDGDGRSDILWRNLNGTVTEWRGTSSGFDLNVYANASVDRSWHIEGAGDFNGDGKADLLWRNDNGTFTIWQSTGQSFTPNVYSNGTVPPNWQIDAIADFNADGRADLLFREASGQFTVWASNGAGFNANAYVGPPVDPSWQVSHFNYDLV